MNRNVSARSKRKKNRNIAEGYLSPIKIKKGWNVTFHARLGHLVQKTLYIRMLNVCAYLSHNFLFRQIFGKNLLA